MSLVVPREAELQHARRSLRSIAITFAGLGFSTGVWSVHIEDLRRSLNMSTAALGVALAVMSAAGLVAGLAGLRRIDAMALRWLTVAGPIAVALVLAALAVVDSYAALLAVLIVYGVSATVYDISVNTLGGAYERRFRTSVMTRLHAGFSVGAMVGALSAGVAMGLGTSYRIVYVLTGAVLTLIAAHLWTAALPDRVNDAETTSGSVTSASHLLRLPGVTLAIGLVTLAYFGDSALEGYASTYLRGTLTSGALLGGAGLATFYGAGAVGCCLGGTTARRLGEPRTIAIAGALIALGIGIAVCSASPAFAIAGLLLVGVASAPLVPIGYSIGSRAAGDRGASVVTLITIAGYGSFVAAPLEVGILSSVVSLRVALATVAVPAMLICAIGLRASD